MIALGAVVGWVRGADAAATFFVAPNPFSTVDPTLDVGWQTAVGGNFTELDLESFACGVDVASLTAGSITIDVGQAGLNGTATSCEIFCGSFGGAAGGAYGTVSGGTLLNRDLSNAKHSEMTFSFSEPVFGFGLWVFDNSTGSRDSFRMTVTECGGATTTSGVLESGNGFSHFVEGFLGATSSLGITAVSIEVLNQDTGAPELIFFEVDHLQVATGPPLHVSVPAEASLGLAGQTQPALEIAFPPDANYQSVSMDTGNPLNHTNFHNDAADWEGIVRVGSLSVADRTASSTIPPSVDVSSCSGTLDITATGMWRKGGLQAFEDPDGFIAGGNGINHEEYDDFGISRVSSTRASLLGVFLTNDPPSTPAPATLTRGISNMTAPVLQQTFVIGSSLSGITIPSGATRLFFGFHNGSGWFNNDGDVCVAVECAVEGPICGNDIVEDGEECDDGNNVGGDGCSALCEIENEPPDCNAGGPYDEECGGATTAIALNGSLSSDPDLGDTLEFMWTTNCPGGTFDDAALESPTLTVDSVAPCPLNCEVTLIVSDGTDNSTCTASVTIQDTLNPSITCPANVGAPTDPNVCQATGVDLGMPSTSDSCGVADVSNDAPTVFPKGTTIVTWTVEDGCGNTDTCTQLVIVNDVTPPSIECPLPDVELDADGNCEAFVTLPVPAANDECPDKTVTVTGQRSDGLPLDVPYPKGQTAVTWTADDGNGNQASCTQLVIVNDVTPPVLTAPDKDELECSTDLPAAETTIDGFLTLVGADANDNCTPQEDLIVSSVDGPLVGDECSGTITRTYTITDESNNSSNVDHVFNVSDDTDPTATGPDKGDLECSSDLPAAETTIAGFLALAGTAADDNCTAQEDLIVSSVDGPLVGTECSGTITRTYTITDDCGNSTDVDHVFNVSDDTNPMITCPDDETIISGDPIDPTDTGEATATDNCDDDVDITFTDHVVFPDCLADPVHFVIERTWTATDDCDNSTSCLQVITVMRQKVSLIIKQGACPAPVNAHSNGVVPMLLVGEPGFDVTAVLTPSLRVSRCECSGGDGSVPPIDGPPGPKIQVLDLNHPFDGEVTCNGPCACNDDQSSDGIDDLSMKFPTDDMVSTLPLSLGEGLVVLSVTGELDAVAYPAGPINVGFVASDCIFVVPPGAVELANAFVGSNSTDTFVEITPLDLNVDSDGFTNFGRAYFSGTSLTLTAPARSDGRRFVRWSVNGVMQDFGVRTLEVLIEEDINLRAIYERQDRLRPDMPREDGGDLD